MEDLESRVDDVLSTRRALHSCSPPPEEEDDSVSDDPGKMSRSELSPTPNGAAFDPAVQDELARWLDSTRALRQFGLQPGRLEKLRAAAGGAPFLLLDVGQSEALRGVVRTLMDDCDRRQALLQDIIVSNTEMKAEVKRQAEVAQRFERKAKDLKGLLEASRQRIQDLSEEKAMSEGRGSCEADRQRNTKEAAVARARQMERKCEQQEEEIMRLRRKVTKLTQEDAERQKRQRELFRRLRHRPASQKLSPMDERVLDVIDAYEHQLEALRRERDLLGGSALPEQEQEEAPDPAALDLRLLVKELQERLRSSAELIAGLEEEKELLTLDLNSRPSMRDYNNAQVRLRRYEKLLRQHNVDVRTESKAERSGRPVVYSAELSDLDFLPLNQCREYLRAVCQELDLSNLDEIVITAKELRRLAAEHPSLLDFAQSVDNIVSSPSAPPIPAAFNSPRMDGQVSTPNSQSSEGPEAERRRQVLAVLDFWLDQLSALPELRASLLRLHTHLFPWRPRPPDVGAEVCSLVGLVDGAVEEEGEEGQEKTPQAEKCPDSVAQGLVSHFQRLFDCPRSSAVYTRMNDVYAKLSELRTLFSNIGQTLGLDPSSGPAHVFDAVTSLCRTQAAAGQTQLRQVVDPQHIARALEKLDEYDDFFPTFQQLVTDLMALLSVASIDRILPAVRSLKRVADLQSPD